MNSLINQYNKYRESNLLQKALTSATGVGEALIPQNLEKEITNTIIRLSPEMALVYMKKIAGKTHEFNRLTALPRTGGAMGEAASTITSNSQTIRDNVQLKIIRRKGEITNFLQDTSQEYIDAAAYETENLLQQHIYDLINTIVYGNGTANPYEFDGLDTLISTNRLLPTDRYGDTLADLSTFDTMIDKSNRAGGARHKRCLIMSPELLSKTSQLLDNVRLNQGLLQGGLTQVNINGGWRLNAYRDIPIIESTGTRPTNEDTALTTYYGTLGSSTAATGGTVAADTYYIQIAAVTEEGEQLASAEITQVTTGTTSTLTITWEFVANAYRYKIYSSGTTSVDKTLVRVVAADEYNAVGTITGKTESYTFLTNPLAADTSVPTSMQSDVQLEKETAHDVPEQVFLWDLDPIQGLGKVPFTNSGGSRFSGIVTIEQLARTDDNIPMLIKSYLALTPSFERTSIYKRGVRTA